MLWQRISSSVSVVMSSTLDRDFTFKDIIVQCTSDDVGNLALAIFGIQLGLERVSTTKWKHESVIVIPPSLNELAIVARLTGRGDIGHVILTKDDWSKIPDTGRSGTYFLKRNFETEGLNFALSIHFQIISVPALVLHVTSTIRNPLSHGRDAFKAERLNLSGHRLLQAFEATRKHEDISRAIEEYIEAAACLPVGDPRLGRFLLDICTALGERYDKFRCTGDLQKLIIVGEMAIGITPVGHQFLPILVANLGTSFSELFVSTGSLADISKAIDNQERALQLTPNEHPDFPGKLSNLGLSLFRRFERTGKLDDLSKSIENHQLALQLTRSGDDLLPSRLTNLGLSMLSRFERIGDFKDVSQAIETHQRALRLTRPGDAHYLPARYTNLGNTFFIRFGHTGALEDISNAIENQERAVELTPDGHPSLQARLNNLGRSFLGRYNRTGNLEDLSIAIKHQQRALELIPDGHVRLPARLTNLGDSFSTRFERTGDLHDLYEAIQNQLRSVQLTPDGDAELPARLSSLGDSFLTRFKHREDLNDLHQAIENHQRGVKFTPEGHTYLPARLSSLGNSFSSRFEVTGDLGDISKAIEHHQHAVRLTPDGHANFPHLLANLGNAFSDRFLRTGHLDDISKAIENKRRAVQLIADGHADLPALLSNLGLSLLQRFKRTSDLHDLSKAIESHQRAVQHTPDGHAHLPSLLSNLGDAFAFRFAYNREFTFDFLIKALSSYHLSSTSYTGRPSLRLKSAKKWADLSRISPDTSSQLLDAHACIIQLLSIVSGLENTIQHRHQILVDSSQLSIAASAAALSLGRPDKALEWLVEGRCIVWNQINQLRTPLDGLRAHDRDLADRFSAVSKELEDAGSRSDITGLSKDDKISSEILAGKHVKLAKEHEKLLATIRNVAGFEDFLQPKRCADIMRTLPDEGVVVIINVHVDRCDALALMSGAHEPMHIPMPKLSYQKAERLAKGLRGYLTRRGGIRRIGMPLDDIEDPVAEVNLVEVLSLLWSDAVWPILEALGFCVPDTECESLPRIWWCPTGPLAFLPIHAAGNYVKHEGTPKQCLSDFAVSSYIPTINSLLKPMVSKSVKRPDGILDGLLIVSQPNTPRKTPIPFATDEADRIRRQLAKGGIHSITLDNQRGTVDEILKAMDSFPCIHLACHASQRTTNPLKSAIYLHDGPLELSEIMKKNLSHSEFAFLSACQTGAGDENLPDEVVHLAAGMLAAGYRSVVGTMWSIFDKHGPDIAEFFYETLLEDARNEGSKIVGTGAARALHRATRRFRDRFFDSPDYLLVWVPYIHIGV